MKWIIKRFNELTPDELYDILRLRSEVFVAEQKCAYQDIDGADKKAYQLLAYEPDGSLSGSLRILDKGQTFEEAAIGRVAVPTTLRGRGYAREMMERALGFMTDAMHENTIKIEAQVYLVEFYKSLGFRTCSEPFLEDGIPHIQMVWQKS